MSTRPPRLTANVYRTPTDANRGGDYQWSVGVMNMARDEADLVLDLIGRLQQQRDRAKPERTQPVPYRPGRLTWVDDVVVDNEPEPEPAREPDIADRFQGLDLG